MNERRNLARGANEWADTYGNLGLASPAQLIQLPLNILDPWVDATGETQPFKPYSHDKLEELTENIRKNGVIEPICVRPMPGGRFQIIAGHNRVSASKLAGLSTIPALVKQMDDSEAAIRMVDSNLQHREKLLPSEKAYAYKLRLDTIKRTAGRPANNCGPVGHNFDTAKSREIIADESGESARQIQRYIRLTFLDRALLELVDNEKFAFRAAVEVSYLSTEEQELLLRIMAEVKCKAPSMTQATQLRKMSQDAALDNAAILSILKPEKAPKAPASIKLPSERISSFFPQDTSPEDMEAEIYEALAFYRKHKTPASA